MSDEKSCKTCFWCSKNGYCVESGKAPVLCKEVCDKYKPIKNVVSK